VVNIANIIVEIVEPNITTDENKKRIHRLENTLSSLFKRKITITVKT